MTLIAIGVVAVLVIVNGLFVATEFAVVASRPAVLEEAVEKNLEGGSSCLQGAQRSKAPTVGSSGSDNAQ